MKTSRDIHPATLHGMGNIPNIIEIVNIVFIPRNTWVIYVQNCMYFIKSLFLFTICYWEKSTEFGKKVLGYVGQIKPVFILGKDYNNTLCTLEIYICTRFKSLKLKDIKKNIKVWIFSSFISRILKLATYTHFWLTDINNYIFSSYF